MRLSLALSHQRIESLLAVKKAPRRPLRSLLYVPSTQNKLNKSLTEAVSGTDTVIFDLEDSIPISKKLEARDELCQFLSTNPGLKSRLAIRINSLGSGFEEDDLREVLSLDVFNKVEAADEGSNPDASRLPRPAPVLLLPKIDHPGMLSRIATLVKEHRTPGLPRVPLIASIESAESLMNVAHIASWRGEGTNMTALLFAAEDFCASTGIIRSKDRRELYFARSQIVIAAKAFDLSAIDMVCINYKDPGVLKEESEEGRRLGFDGKQAIHPTQITEIQRAFSPSLNEIHRANLIIEGMKASELAEKGAFGLEINNKWEMIDEPMLKGARRTMQIASLLGLTELDRN